MMLVYVFIHELFFSEEGILDLNNSASFLMIPFRNDQQALTM